MSADYVARALSSEHELLRLARLKFGPPDDALIAAILAAPLPMRSATVTAKSLIDRAFASGYEMRHYVRVANWLLSPPYTPEWARRGSKLRPLVDKWPDGTPGKKNTAIVLAAAELLQECYAKPDDC